MLMADVHVDELAREIQVAVALEVPDLGSGAARDHERI
jgi:hypothetical protein